MHHIRAQNQIRLLRCPSVTHVTGLGRSTIYKKMKEGTFPRPLKISVRHVAWREQDILDWIAELPTSQGSDWLEAKPNVTTERKSSSATTAN
jgi:prophage regulatory protein